MTNRAKTARRARLAEEIVTLGKTAAQHYAERKAERAASLRRTLQLFDRLAKVLRPPPR